MGITPNPRCAVAWWMERARGGLTAAGATKCDLGGLTWLMAGRDLRRLTEVSPTERETS